MLSRARKLTLATVLISVLGAFGAYTATASASTPAVVPAAVEPPMPFAIEDFSYPNAERIQATQGIKLIRGDGRIVLATCDNNVQQIRVFAYDDATSNDKPVYCFYARSTTGYLTLELDRVFAIDTDDHPVSADLSAGGVTKSVDVAKDGYESVGEGVIGGARSVLVEIRVTG